MPGTDLEVLQSPDDVISALHGGELPQVEDPAAVNRRIMDAILEADTVEGVFAEDRLVSTEAIAGVPITVRAITVMRSRMNGDIPVFMVVDATTLTEGTDVKITTSATKVMAKLAKLYQLDAFPIDVVIERSAEQTAQGYYFYDLQRAGATS